MSARGTRQLVQSGIFSASVWAWGGGDSPNISSALIVGSSNIITPKASVAALLPSFSYLAAWFALAGFAYIFIGMETKGRSLEKIEQDLDASRATELRSVKAEENR